MSGPLVLAIVFEGGQAPTDIEREMVSIRHEICLDTIERLLAAGGISTVLLVTSSDGLASRAFSLGARVRIVPAEGFHFGGCLSEIIREIRPESVICMGGASVPLAMPDDFDAIARRLCVKPGAVISNNFFSCDIVGFRPASAIECVKAPAEDNFLAYLLREAGLMPTALDAGPKFDLDIDTPADAAVLRCHPDAGERAVLAIDRVRWGGRLVEGVLRHLRQAHCRVFLSGRVSPAVMTFIRDNFKWRLRVVSEERGLKALGAEKSGPVRSLTGILTDMAGADGFFQILEGICDVAFIDTRVLFAHWGIPTVASERFYSDIGDVGSIKDRRMREFTEAALRSPLRVVLGGHSLVNAGIWALGEAVRKELTICGRSPSLEC